jgi:hypothetical protein
MGLNELSKECIVFEVNQDNNGEYKSSDAKIDLFILAVTHGIQIVKNKHG